MGGGSYETYGAPFNMGQQDILLGLVESVDLVDEEGGGRGMQAID